MLKPPVSSDIGMKNLNVTSESLDIAWHYFLYDGSLPDVLINYTLILIYSLALLCPCQGFLRPRVLFTLLHSGLCVGLQVSCWLLAGAYGISLVWCGQMGQLVILLIEMVNSKTRKPPNKVIFQGWKKRFSRELYLKMICCLPGTVAIVYYYSR